jgi:hypothetical protein
VVGTLEKVNAEVTRKRVKTGYKFRSEKRNSNKKNKRQRKERKKKERMHERKVKECKNFKERKKETVKNT